MLFASIDGISKCGYYSGGSGNVTLELGFPARFILIKRTNAAGDWCVFDTHRGIAGGDDGRLHLNKTAVQDGTDDWIDPYSNGIIINNDVHQDILTTSSSDTYVYYAHA